jgi:sugar (pentulose or hexulose) kinase
MKPYFIGIDIGTQGVRIALLDHYGNLLVSIEEAFPLSATSRTEQSPLVWWDCCLKLMQKLVDEAGENVIKNIISIAVTSTSGTVIPLDKNNEPEHNAIMYSDNRSTKEAEKCTQAALKFHKKGFTAFNSSTGLAKMVWFVENYPEKVAGIARWIHAADYITGKLSDVWGVTDYTNAFKSGFDVTELCWPDYLFTKLPLKKEWLPIVYPSGDVIGKINKDLALKLGLPKDVNITTGITDGCASQIASGAMNLGDWNTTIGTTLVVKGITKNEILDPFGRIYNHRHPQGFWMPGGASNTGADWVTEEFSNDLAELNEQAADLFPTGYMNYPLRQKGERFPLNAPQARGFKTSGISRAEEFTANMEGVAFIERYAFELIEELSNEKVHRVFTAGGGSNSEVWLKIRANVLNKPIFKMKHVSGAVGAAILAASKTYFNNLTEATKALTVIESKIIPEKELVEQYEVLYLKFIILLQEKGFLTPN